MFYYCLIEPFIMKIIKLFILNMFIINLIQYNVDKQNNQMMN